MSTAVPAAVTLHRLEAEMGAVARRVRRVAMERAELVDPGLGPLGYGVLEHLVSHGPARASELSVAMCVDKGAMSRAVQSMLDLDLVQRAADPDDRRAHRIDVTDRARERLEAMVQRRRSAFLARFADWSPGDLELFVELLGRYNATLDRRDEHL